MTSAVDAQRCLPFQNHSYHLSNPDLSHADVVVPAAMQSSHIGRRADALYVQLRDGAVSRLLRIGYEPGSKPEPVALPYDGAIGLYRPTSAYPVLSLSSHRGPSKPLYEYDPKTNTVVEPDFGPCSF